MLPLFRYYCIRSPLIVNRHQNYFKSQVTQPKQYSPTTTTIRHRFLFQGPKDTKEHLPEFLNNVKQQFLINPNPIYKFIKYQPPGEIDGHILLLRSFVSQGLPQHANILIGYMKSQNISIDKLTFDLLAEMHASKTDLRRCWDILKLMEAHTVAPDNITYAFIMKGLAHRRHFTHINTVLETMKRNNYVVDSVVYALVIDQLSEDSNVRDGYKLYLQAIASGVQPDEDIFLSLLRGCAKVGDVDLYDILCRDMKAYGITRNAAIAEQSLLIYIRSGDFTSAQKVFAELYQRADPGGWLVQYMVMCAENTQLEHMVDVYRQIGDGVIVDRDSFCSILRSMVELGESVTPKLLEDVLSVGVVDDFVLRYVMTEILKNKKDKLCQLYFQTMKKAINKV